MWPRTKVLGLPALLITAGAAQYAPGLPALLITAGAAQYAPTWDSLDTRPLPTWYDDAKVGIFIHWGVFSVPSFGVSSGGASGEWFWWEWQGSKDPAYSAFVAATEAPQWTYADYAPRFQAEFFNASQWASLFKASGARYIVPTSKHHEGFTNWPSATSFNWNSVDVGPHRDLIGELATAVKAAGLTFGIYHSLFEWFNPLFLEDEAAKFAKNITTSEFLQKTFGELHDLVNRYEPELIWSDGDWMAPDAYWSAPENFLAWLVNDSPVKDTVVFNDRWGQGDTCAHGSYWTCADRYLPSKTQGRKWENAFTIDRDSWGYRRNGGYSDYLSVAEIVNTVVGTVSLGGNALINVGPSHDGTIDAIFADRLLGLGAWLSVNGAAIYGTRPWRSQNETAAHTWYTASPGGAVNAIFTAWPAANTLTLATPVAGDTTTATLLGFGPVQVTPLTGKGAPGVKVALPSFAPGAAPCEDAWTVVFTAVT